MNRIVLFLGVLLVAGQAAFGVEMAETGKPLMTVYTAKETDGHSQNWAFMQDDRGVMYIGNGYGVQEFDGSSWRLILAPNRSFARSFAKDSAGRIYVGSGAELGYLETGDCGDVKYVSLLDYINERDRALTTVMSIQVTPEGIYFQSLERLFRFRQVLLQNNSGQKQTTWEVKTWEPQNAFRGAHWMDEALYVFQVGLGLFKMENDSLSLVPGSERFQDNRVYVILPFPASSGTYLVGTAKGELYTWNGRTFERFATEADELLHDVIIYAGVVLPDGLFAISTLSDGFFVIDPAGKLKSHFTEDSGLTSNVIQALYVDRQRNVWVGMDGGIAILEYDSPFVQFATPSGSIFNSLIKYDGTLYAACNFGLYFLDRDSEFKPVGGSLVSGNQVFQLYQIKNDLFACSGRGVCGVKGGNAWQVLTVDASGGGVNCLHTCRGDSSTILAGITSGVMILKYDAKDPKRLRYVGQIPGIHEYVYTIAESEPGVLWFGTFDEGAIRLQAPDYNFDGATIERFGPGQNLPSGTAMVFRAAERLFFTTAQGVLRFDESRRKFEPEPLFADVTLGRNAAEGVIVDDADGNIWANLGSESAVFRKDAGGAYRLQKQILSRFGEEPVYSIYPERNGTVWFGVASYVFRFTPEKRQLMVQPGASLIRQVTTVNDSIIYDGAGSDGNRAETRLPFRLNELHFEFATPSYVNPRANEFQTMLEGFDKHWSEWSLENKRYYTNMPAGKYRFLVKARNINNEESEPAFYAFAILPPWYSTLWARLILICFGAGLIYALVRLRTRQLRQRSKALENVVQERTAEIQEQKNNVEQLSIIGRNITGNLSIKDIINTVYENVNTLMEASVFGIGLYQEGKRALVFPATKEKGSTLPEFSVPLSDEDRLAVWCFKNQKDVVINDYGRDYVSYVRHLKPAMAGENPESILYLPLQHKDRTIGVITAQSFEKNAYTEYHVNILRNLATYSAIALENADAYRRLNELLDDLKTTQEKLVTQSKLAALGALTAGIAHEIKNPLNFVNNFAELSKDLVHELEQELARDPSDKAAILEIMQTLRQNAEKINEHGKRADSIVKSMLQHSRGKAGERQPSDINAMLQEDLNLAYHGMRAQDSSFNIKMETELDPSVGKLEVVPQDISRVFLNIINNGCYEAHRKKVEQNGSFSPTLLVRTRDIKDNVEIRIRDNGNGIPEEVRDKLFTPFFTTKPAGQGTGLGLSISYDIVVHGHNGQILFETEKGEFTEFIIRLPKIKQ